MAEPLRSTKADPDGVFPILRAHALCDPTDPSQRCSARNAAQASGEFFPDFELGGWVFADGPRRSSTFRAKYYDLNEHDEEPIRIVDCPWCGNELPTTDEIKRYYDERSGDDQC